MLTVSALLLLGVNWQLIAQAGWPVLFVLAGLTLSALIVGHLMGGKESGERTALAVACAIRHLGLAVLIAAAVPGPKTPVFVAAYIVFSAIVSISCLKWQSKVDIALAKKLQ